MAKRKTPPKKKSQRKRSRPRKLDLNVIELLNGQWAVVSADAAKPLTEKEAMHVAACYMACVELGVAG
jgi:hypothetical protein